MSELTVMTCNVRQPDQDDGANTWENRRELLVETISAAAADLLGTQELFSLQADYLIARLPGYEWFGRGRFGDTREKHVGIFYNTARLKLLEHGDFWLSETPDVPGSSAWDIIRPRQVTWGRFETAEGMQFQHLNTHFPYRREEQEARRQTAALILSRLGCLSPVILTGDFNSPADGEIHASLCRDLQDAWTMAGCRRGPESTLNGFGRYTGSRRIDWILYRGPWSVVEAATIDVRRGDIYPSDHFPVMARFGNQPLRAGELRSHLA